MGFGPYGEKRMKDWKNPELRRELLICGLASLILAGLGLLISPLCAALVLLSGLILTGQIGRAHV